MLRPAILLIAEPLRGFRMREERMTRERRGAISVCQKNRDEVNRFNAVLAHQLPLPTIQTLSLPILFGVVARLRVMIR
jgi:hypothetical protein